LSRPLSVLGVSHACVIDLNQRLWDELGRQPGLHVDLVAPRSWRIEGRPQPFKSLLAASFRSFPLPVVFSGQLMLHFYRSRLPPLDPDLVLTDEEPASLCSLQMALFARARYARLAIVETENLVKHYPLPFRAIEQVAYRQAAVAVPNNPGAAHVLRAKGFAKRIELVPFSVDLEAFEPGANAGLRGQLSLAGVVLGYVGRLVPQKGVDVFIDALSQLAGQRRLPAWTALIVGDGPERSRLEEQARLAGLSHRVRFVGSVPHAAAGRYLQAVDVLVLPSRTTPRWKEQFGRVITEALACGKPVVGSDSGNIPVLIAETGGGLTFPEGDAAALADCAAQLIADAGLRHDLAAAGRELVLQRYDVRRQAARLAAVLREVAA